jgi:hypothetical protein
VRDWVAEFEADRYLGGSSSKFTMTTPGQRNKLLLGQPRPPLTLANHADQAAAHAVSLSKNDAAPAVGGGPDVSDRFLGEDSEWTGGASIGPSLGDHVEGVVGGGPQEQVADVEAGRFVAPMENLQANGDRSVFVLPDDSVSTLAAEENVPSIVASLQPGEATTGRVGDRLGHQPVIERALGHVRTLQSDLLVRLQRAEFSKWTDTGLRRRWTSVLAGTGCVIRNAALREIAYRSDREGPWTYASMVEDFELTYRIRQLGYHCHISPTVRAYTDAMRTVRSLWAQRMKWQVGTVEDLLSFGVTKLTYTDWRQQAAGLLAAAVRISWVAFTLLALVDGSLHMAWLWLIAPAFFIANDVKQALRIPHRDRRDVLLAALLLPQEFFAWLRAGWFLAAWCSVLTSRVTRRRKDRWAMQYVAEGVDSR